MERSEISISYQVFNNEPCHIFQRGFKQHETGQNKAKEIKLKLIKQAPAVTPKKCYFGFPDSGMCTLYTPYHKAQELMVISLLEWFLSLISS